MNVLMNQDLLDLYQNGKSRRYREVERNSEKKFLVNDITPAFPVHPGSLLGEELKARGISQKQFAESVGMQTTHLSALIHGTRNFTAAVAEKVASGLEGISAEFWTKCQERYNIDIRRKRINTTKLVAGYKPASFEVQPVCLAQPQAAYNGNLQVTLIIPESDKELLEGLAGRLGWACH